MDIELEATVEVGAEDGLARSQSNANMATGELGSSTATPTFLEPGAMIKHYEIIRELGAGGMGMVFLARDTRLGRLVAIKFLLQHTGLAAQRFLEEARTTALCRHENIVVIYDVDEFHGYPYMVLEYIQGRTLRAAMTTPGPATAVELMLPVTRALACAHEMGIVHRDLKPENILLSGSGHVKVLDFGIAKRVSRDSTQTPKVEPSRQIELMALTQDGALVGTMPYMSPEQWLQEPLDARTDIWAAGIILFELAMGEHPLEPLSMAALLEVTDLDTPFPSVYEKLPGARPLAEVIERCLKKRKNERINSAQELTEALERLGAEQDKPALVEHESPFAGLSAFQESDSGRFFGRDRDIAAAVGRLHNQELLAIVGPSGAGKSSFVRAGVIPALKRAGRPLEAFALRPGRRPLAALAEVLAFFGDDAAAADEADPEAIAEMLRMQPGYLGAKLRARCRKQGSNHRIVLVVDQLEELYTLGIEAKERAAFCACLEGVADDASSPLRVIATIRADFLDRLTEDRHFLGMVARGLLFLPPMTTEGLRDALEKPITGLRYRFEDDALVGEMLDDLAGMKSPLPILQFTATKLWEARDQQQRLLLRETYRTLGGVAGALSTHADAVLSGLPSADQRMARQILLRLVTPERTRAIVRMDELCALSEDAIAVERIVLHLADARLLSIEAEGEQEGKTVELTHESLIERWAKLKQWLDDDEQDVQFLTELRNAASQWEKNGEAEGFLWRDQAARKAGSWLEQHTAEGKSGLGKRELKYLEAVVALSERTRRRTRQFVAALFAAITVVAVVVGVLAIQARMQAKRADEQTVFAKEETKRADEHAQEAQEEARQARNATRMAAAREMQADPTTVLALLREIEPGSVPRGWQRSALTASASSPRLLTRRCASGTPTEQGHPSSFGATTRASLGRRLAPMASASSPRHWTRRCGSGTPTARDRPLFSGDMKVSLSCAATNLSVPTADASSLPRTTPPCASGTPTVQESPSCSAPRTGRSIPRHGAQMASASSRLRTTKQSSYGTTSNHCKARMTPSSGP